METELMATPGGSLFPSPAGIEQDDTSQFHGYPVELDAFQGPLDLLLQLIKKDRIEIWQISISRITRQYLDYLSTLQSLNIEVAGEFLVMAATLMRIKSQNLLPRPTFLEVDEEEEPLTREGLIARLVEYRRFREAARTMAEMEARESRRHSRGCPATLDPHRPLPLREPRLFDLAEYLESVLSRQAPVTRHEVQLEEFKLEEQMEWVRWWLEAGEGLEPAEETGTWGLAFKKLLRRPGNRLELVVTFLAVLELARLQKLTVHQRRPMEEIWLFARLGAAMQPPSDSGGELP